MPRRRMLISTHCHFPTMAAPEVVRDFLALLDAAHHVPNCVFRGQTRDHAILTPSLYRGTLSVDIRSIRPLLDRFFLEVTDRIHGIQEKVRRDEEAESPPVGGLLGVDSLLATLGGISSFHLADDTDPPGPEEPSLFERFTELGDWWRNRHEPRGWWSTDELDEPRHRWVPTFSAEVERDPRPAVFYAKEAAFMARYQHDHYSLARLQHYGVPTGALDVTYDPYIALWFATWRMRMIGLRRGYYEPSDSTGVVYLIDPGDRELGDLRHVEVVPLAGLRAQRQQGALLLGATAESPDLSGYVVAKVVVTPGQHSLLEQWRLHLLSQHTLFPPPSEDAYYGFLLNARAQGSDGAIREAARWIIEYHEPPDPAA